MSDQNEVKNEEKEFSTKGLTIVIPLWLEKVKNEVEDSPYFRQLKEKLATNSNSGERYREIDGVWYYKERNMLDPSSELCKIVFQEHHSTLSRGHFRYYQTFHRTKNFF